MKCVICGKEHSDEACPVCQFPVIHFLGDPVEGMRTVKHQIDKRRGEFLTQLRVGIVIYTWKDSGGTIVLDQEKEITLGTGAELRQNVRWASQEFARVPDDKQIEIKLAVHYDQEKYEHQLSVPNLMEAELQKIGAALDEDMNVQVFLKNSSSQSHSEKEPLFL